MRWLEFPLRLTDKLAALMLGLMLVAITLILFVNAMARYFAGIAIVGGEELARCLMVWMTFLGSYLLVRTQAHIAIDVLAILLKPATRKILVLVICCLGIVITAYFFMLGYELTVRIFSSGQRMSSVPLPRGWFYLSIPVGMGLMCVAFLQTLLATITGLAQPKVSDFSLPDVETTPVEAASEGKL